MRYADYLLLKRGYNDKLTFHQLLLRKVAHIVISPWLNKSVDPNSIWKIGDGKPKKIHVSDASLAVLRKFKEAQRNNGN